MQELKKIYKHIQSYIIVIFITISVTTFIMLGSSDSSFVENFNFASTITSIILSIIAILITLIDGEKNNSILNKITDATSNIDESTVTLHDASSKIEEFIDKLTETHNSLLSETSQLKEVAATMYDERFITKDLDLSLTSSLDLDFTKLIYSVPYGIRQYMLFAYETYKSSKRANIYYFSEFFTKEMSKNNLPSTDISNSILTTLYLLQGFKLLSFELEAGILIINFFDKDFEDAIVECIPSEEFYSDSNDLRFFESVRKYFKSIK